MKQIILLASAIIFFSNCTPKSVLGLYQTVKKGTMSFEGKNLHFLDAQKFEYIHWSDEINSNKKGKGTYQLKDSRLILTFGSYPASKESIMSEIINSDSPNVQKAEIKISGDKNAPLIAVPVVLTNSEREIIGNCVTDKNGFCTLNWKTSQNPINLQASYLGYEKVNIKIDKAKSIRYEIAMAEICNYVESGEVWEFKIKQRNDNIILSNDLGKTLYYKYD